MIYKKATNMKLVHFARNDDGGVAIIFAITLLPLMMLIGFAIDYAMAMSARSDLQNRIDGTAIQALRNPSSIDDIRESLNRDGNLSFDVSINPDGTIHLKVRGEHKTMFSNIIGIDTIPIEAEVRARMVEENYLLPPGMFSGIRVYKPADGMTIRFDPNL